MPKVMIKDRFDREGPVKLTLGPISKTLPRNKEIEISSEELEVLMHSHESNYVFVYPEVNHGTVDRTERPSADPGRDEAGARQGGQLR